MKKLCLLTIALCTVCASKAQTEYSVPDLTIEQKYDATKALMNRNICSAIVLAKVEGVSAEEFGRKNGRLWIPNWDKSTEFEEFVGFAIWAWAVLTDEVKILEQSANKVVLLVPSVSKELEEEPVLDSFSIEDLIAYYDGIMQEIATHLDFNMKMSWGDKGMSVIFTR